MDDKPPRRRRPGQAERKHLQDAAEMRAAMREALDATRAGRFSHATGLLEKALRPQQDPRQ